MPAKQEETAEFPPELDQLPVWCSGSLCGSRRESTVGAQNRIRFEADEAIRVPLGFAHDSLFRETRSSGHGTTAFVLNGGRKAHTAEVEFLEGTLHQCC